MRKSVFAAIMFSVVTCLMGATEFCVYVPTCQEVYDDVGCQASSCESSVDPFQCVCIPDISTGERIQCRGPLPNTITLPTTE